MWRTQEPRTLEDIDLLIQRQEQLRRLVGEDKAKEIAAKPENFADADAFRIFHAKARFRATVTTVVAAVAVSSVAAPKLGYSSGVRLLKANSVLTLPALVGTWCTSYMIWNRVVGWNSQQRNEWLFAKNIRMLRNIQIRQ